jgi:phage-related protein (TIGR01555 family)
VHKINLVGGLVRAAVERLDGFVNAVAGIGSDSKIFASRFTNDTVLDGPTLEALYLGSWMARRVVEVLPEQALKKGFCFEGDVSKEDERATLQEYRRLTYTPAFPKGTVLEAANQGRLYGGAGLILGAQSGAASPELPLGESARLLWTDVANRHQLKIVAKQTDPNAADFGQPVIVELTDHPRKGLRLHTSRIIWFQGDPSAGKQKREKHADFWSESVLQVLFSDLARCGDMWNSIGYMFQEASIPVIKLKGLFEALAQEDSSVIGNRLKLLSQGKSVAKTIFLDADPEYGESFERIKVDFTGLPELIKESVLNVSGAAKTPISIFIGQQHGGLNTTGEEDLSQWYDHVGAYQKNDLGPKLEQLISIIRGKPTPIEFESLHELSELEEATRRKDNAIADKTLVDAGIVDPLEIAISRAQDGTLGFTVDVPALQKLLNEERAVRAPDPNAPPRGAQ